MMTFDFNKLMLAATFAFATVSAEESCKTIAELACENDSLKTLCTLATSRPDIAAALSTSELTVFAPTDDAFAAVDQDLLAQVGACGAALDSVLLFHATPGTVYAADLACAAPVPMANGDDSRTVCAGGAFYQKGSSNSRDMMPKIVGTDIEACNGVVHVVDQVLLPKLNKIPFASCVEPPAPVEPVQPAAPDGSCLTIASIACEDPNFSVLCSLVKGNDLAEALSSGNWTVFAPTDEAFGKIAEVTADLTPGQLLDVLMFHVVAEQAVTSDQLVCKGLISMANEDTSRTRCVHDEFGNEMFFQRGPGNTEEMLPKITAANLKACNGIVHVVDNVMIPKL
jgi:uncharacterized surface protein with fasciclin (FAS1) repeats